MDILHTIFEEQLKFSINSDGKLEFEFGETELTAAAVLKTDPEAYKAEFRAWLNDVWLDKHRSRLRTTLKIYGNEQRFNDLCACARTAVPVVGSGMSSPTGLPCWSQLLHNLRSRTSMLESELNAMLGRGEYEEAVDKISSELGRRLFEEQIEHNLRVEPGSSVQGAVRLLPLLFPNLVITTNLDDVLEQVYEGASKRLVHVLAGKPIERYRRLDSSGESCLLKLYGDRRIDDGRVLGATEYDAAYSRNGTQWEALSLISRTKPLLWLGCSLTDDRTVRLLADVASKDEQMPRSFAFLQLPGDDAIWRDREVALAHRNIFPIWYEDDHDASIETLLVGLLDRQNRFAEA